MNVKSLRKCLLKYHQRPYDDLTGDIQLRFWGPAAAKTKKCFVTLNIRRKSYVKNNEWLCGNKDIVAFESGARICHQTQWQLP